MKVLLTHTLGLTLLAPALVLALPPYPNVTIPSGLSLSEIEATAATTLPESPASNVKSLAFHRFYQL